MFLSVRQLSLIDVFNTEHHIYKINKRSHTKQNKNCDSHFVIFLTVLPFIETQKYSMIFKVGDW